VRVLKKELWPYQISIPLREWGPDHAPEKWCKEHVGRRFKEWYSWKDKQERTWMFAFKDEATLLVFKLAWRW
jgi:hypothetical protein